jgi:apolipoprotein N-acyltransferase
LAVVLLSLYLAVFPAWRRRGWFCGAGGARVPGFAGLWIVTEWLRSWLFTGFAWNPLGVALLGDDLHPGLALLAPWLGTYGLSGLMAGWGGRWRAGSAGASGDGGALVAVPVRAGRGDGWPGPARRKGMSPIRWSSPTSRRRI